MDIKINERRFSKGITFGTYSDDKSNKKVLLYGKNVSDKVVYEVTYIFDNETQLTDYIAVDKEYNSSATKIETIEADTAAKDLKKDILERIDKGSYKDSSFIDFKNVIFNVNKLVAINIVELYSEDN